MSNKATQQEQDFAIVMQKLSAEAEKILPGDQSNSLPEVRDPTEPGQPPHAFFERLHGLENSVLNRLEQIAAQMEASRAAAFAEQFRRIDEQLASIRAHANAENIGCRQKRNGNTLPKATTPANFHGEIMTGAAISLISPIATLFLPGAIAISTMAIPKVHPSAHFRSEPVRLELKTWRAMSWNCVLIITSSIDRGRK